MRTRVTSYHVQKRIYFQHQKGLSYWRLAALYDISPETVRQTIRRFSIKYGVPIRGTRPYYPKKEISIYLLACLKGGLLGIRDAMEMTGMSRTQIKKAIK